jgi:hypothetical protein
VHELVFNMCESWYVGVDTACVPVLINLYPELEELYFMYDQPSAEPEVEIPT